MKILKYLLVAAMSATLSTAFAAPAKTPSKITAQQASKVGEALQSAKYITAEKADKNAKYYIFVYSASWCGPCQREMPEIAKLYSSKISKDPKVELVHFSYDQDEGTAKKWAKKIKATFPVVSSHSKAKIPGSRPPSGIPHMIIVDGDGKMIKEGHGALVKDYAKFIPKGK